MPPNASSVEPHVLWLNAKTPTNFNPAPDSGHKTIIAVRAQRYSTKKREEQGALLFELQRQGASVPPVVPAPFGIFGPTVVSSDAGDTGEVDEQCGGVGKSQKYSYRKGSKRQHRSQRYTDPSRLVKVLSTDYPCSSLVMPLQGGNSDPFASLPIPLSASRHTVMSTIRQMSLRTIWANEVGTPNGSRVLIPTQQKSYKNYLTHEAAMHALFAYCWSVMARMHPHNKETYYRSALEHEIRGTSVLQPLLETLSIKTENLDAALHAIVLLCSAAVFRSRFDAVLMHLKGLREIIRCLGGINKLHWLRRDTVIYLVVRVAANTRTRTVLEPASWDPGSWSDNKTAKAVHPVTSEGTPEALCLSDSYDFSRQTNQLPDIFMALQELVEVEDLKKKVADDDEMNSLFRWSQPRRQAVRARVLNHWCDLTEPTHAVDHSLNTVPTPTTVHHATTDMCLCLAIHLFMGFGLEALLLKQDWVSTIQIWHIMLLRCIHKLGFEIEKIDGSQAGARDLLWICATGAFVEDAYLSMVLRDKPTFWTLYDADEVDIRWFSVRFGVLARRLRYKVYDEVAAVFEQHYVHIPVLQDVVLGRLFNFEW